MVATGGGGVEGWVAGEPGARATGFEPSPLAGEGGERSEPGEGWGLVPPGALTPHPRPLSRKGRGEKDPRGRARGSPGPCGSLLEVLLDAGAGLRVGRPG